MKTIVIWDTCGVENLKFFILSGDKSHLDNVYLNAYSDDAEQNKLQVELDALVYGPDGCSMVNVLDEFPVCAIMPGDKVIAAGFLP